MAVNRKINAQINITKSPLSPTPECLVGSAKNAVVAESVLAAYLTGQETVPAVHFSVFS